MVVSPRYAEYKDAYDTGTSVPVLLPPSATLQAPLAAECHAADSSPALSGSQSDAQDSSHADSAADSHGQAGTLPYSSQAPAGTALQQRQNAAQYYLCRRGKVDHVFVDHPMYCRTSDIYGSSNVNTYQEAGDFPDLDLRYSILCQAALAAPLLLWHSSQDAWTAKNSHKDCGAAAEQHAAGSRHTADQGPDQTLPGVSHLHLLSAGRVSAAPAAAEATRAPMRAGMPSAGVADADSASMAPAPPLQAAPAGLSISSAALPPAAQGSAQRGPAGSSSQAGVANGTAAAAEHGCHSRVFVREPGQAAGHQSSSMREAPGECSQAAKSAAPLVFVSNDWPCAPLALRLEHSVRSAQASSAASQVHSAPQGAPQGLEHEGSGASISSGEP